MIEMIRCPNCRGAKKVPKLGGMIGECNTCNGDGKIKACDKVKPMLIVENEDTQSMVAQVANALPVNNDDEVIEAVKDVKIDGKKALYKRKKA